MPVYEQQNKCKIIRMTLDLVSGRKHVLGHGFGGCLMVMAWWGYRSSAN